MTSNICRLHWWTLTNLQRALLLDTEASGGSLTFGKPGEQLRDSINWLTELGLVTSESTDSRVTMRLIPAPDQATVDNDFIEAAQPDEPDLLELAGRLMAVVTDAWLNASDRTLPQLHNEALAVLTLAQRQ